jgi:hypothetical protein
MSHYFLMGFSLGSMVTAGGSRSPACAKDEVREPGVAATRGNLVKEWGGDTWGMD